VTFKAVYNYLIVNTAISNDLIIVHPLDKAIASLYNIKPMFLQWLKSLDGFVF